MTDEPSDFEAQTIWDGLTYNRKSDALPPLHGEFARHFYRLGEQRGREQALQVCEKAVADWIETDRGARFYSPHQRQGAEEDAKEMIDNARAALRGAKVN